MSYRNGPDTKCIPKTTKIYEIIEVEKNLERRARFRTWNSEGGTCLFEYFGSLALAAASELFLRPQVET